MRSNSNHGPLGVRTFLPSEAARQLFGAFPTRCFGESLMSVISAFTRRNFRIFGVITVIGRTSGGTLFECVSTLCPPSPDYTLFARIQRNAKLQYEDLNFLSMRFSCGSREHSKTGDPSLERPPSVPSEVAERHLFRKCSKEMIFNI